MRFVIHSTLIGAIALAIAAPGAAAVKKPVRKPVAAKPVVKKPVIVVAAAQVKKPGGFMVPKAVALRAVTKDEAEANAVWNVRAALNVAALQCQFSPFLATVKNYNDLLRHHSGEFMRAQDVMKSHFRRYDGKRFVNAFDQYTTRTYNSYSTLDAQYSFCEVAARVGRDMLTVPKNRLGSAALVRNGEIRESLAERPLSPALAVIAVTPIALPPMETLSI